MRLGAAGRRTLETQWRNRNRGLRIDNTFSFSALDQGGYPYAYAGEDIVRDGKTVIRNGEVRYNDPSSYRRTTVSDGLTVRYDAAKYSVSSITSYQYSDDEMTLDQDFTPESWFTLRQARREHALTEDIVFRSHDGRRYGWLLGAFGFYRHGVMEAPVHFKRTGIEELIVKNANEHLGAIWNEEYSISADELPLYSDFRMPVYGGAVTTSRTCGWAAGGSRPASVSTWNTRRWPTTAGPTWIISSARRAARPRRNASRSTRGTASPTPTAKCCRRSRCSTLSTKCATSISVAKGYKAGGFNTQMFSDILSESSNGGWPVRSTTKRT